MKQENIVYKEYLELYENCKKELEILDSQITSLLFTPDQKSKSMYSEFLKLSKPGDLQALALCLYRFKNTLSEKESEQKSEILKSLAKQIKDWIDVAEKVQYDKNELDEIRELLEKLFGQELLERFLRLSKLDNPIELLWHLKGYKGTLKTNLPDKEKVLSKYKDQIESWFYRAEQNEYRSNQAILKDRERDTLRRAVDVSSSSNRTFFVSYLSVLLYLIITVANVTDEQFLLNKPVKLPWLNIDIPLFGFFLFAPLIFLATHFNTIFNLIKHIELLHVFTRYAGRKDMENLERFQLAPFLFNHLILHEFDSSASNWKQKIPAFLVELVAWIMLMIAPAALLSFVQVRFSAYQNIGFTLWHFFVFILDMLIVSFFFWKVLYKPSQQNLSNKGKLIFHVIATFSLVLINFWNLKYLNEVLSLRGATAVPVLEENFKNSLRFKLFPRLSIRGKNLVESQPSELLQLGAYISNRNIEEFRKENTKGIDVSERNLIYAVFIECNITNANFKKAYLNGAVFFNTNIQDANFFNAEISGAEPKDELKTLRGINKFAEQKK